MELRTVRRSRCCCRPSCAGMKGSPPTIIFGFSVGPVLPERRLARRLEELVESGGLRTSLRAAGINHSELPELASEAAEQWTGTFNPRPFDQQGAIEIYQC